MDDKVKSKLCFWLVIAFYVLIAGGIFYGGYLTGIKHCKKGMPDISTTSKVDTSKSVAPTPIATTPQGYIKVRVVHDQPLNNVERNVLIIGPSEKVSDSTSLDSAYIPITQKEYRDSNYTAWISGYEPRLDSIYVMSRTTTITKTARRFRRWNIGISGGYGYGILSKRFEPYIGFGITFSVFK